MQQEFRERQRKNMERLRRVKDITMAVFILIVAMLLFFARQLGLLVDVSDSFRMWLGGLFTLYGAFRLYRGLKKDIEL